MRALDVTNVRDRRAAKLRRPRHSPARHDEFALAGRPDPDNRRHLIGKDRREGRKVSDAVVAHAKEVADRRLALCDAVKVTHAGNYAGKAPRRKCEAHPSSVQATDELP